MGLVGMIQMNVTTPNQPFKIQRSNTLAEVDDNNNTVYIFVPPFHPKQHDFNVSKTKSIKTSVGQINLDFNGDSLVGIEIPKGITALR